MRFPIFCYDNLLETGTVTASSEATGFAKENAYDWLAYDWWKPTATGFSYLTVDCGTAKPCDYLALHAHDLFTNGSSITLQYSTDDFVADINDAFAAFIPASDGPMVKTFPQLNVRYYRLRILAPNISSIGIAAFGAMLQLPTGVLTGFTPPTLMYDNEVTNHRSNGGAYIGRSVRRRGGKKGIPLRFGDVSAAWVRADWAAFLDHAEVKPFFFSWNQETYPDEAVFAWTEGKLRRPKHHKTLYMQIGLEIMAVSA